MSYFDAVVYSKLAKSSGGITQDQLDAALETKYDKTGGSITGDVAITGNLTVSGTTTTEKEKQLLVEDNVIATNANKVDLQTLLSGLAINKNADATYGIMYDPTDDTVKFGEGTLDENNKFVFKDGEGRPLAIRADSSQFADGYLVKWDEDTMSFVRADLKADNVSKKIDKIDFSNGQATVTFDTADGMTVGGTGMLTYADQSTHQVATDIEIPIIPGNGVIMDATTSANHVTVKVDPEHSVYMATAPEAENAIPVYAKSSKSWVGLTATPSATASSVVTRDASGRMQAGIPANDGDVAIKSYVDTAVGEKQDALTAGTGIDITDNTIKITDKVARLESDTPASYSIPVYVGVGSIGWAETTSSTSAAANTLAARTAKGIVRTATPEADTDAANKKYVDDSVSGKQSILTAGTGISIENDTVAVTKNVATIATLPELPADVVPYYSGDLATWNNKEMAVGARGNTVALRTTSGTLTVATPAAATDAATKAYVDAAIVAEGPASTIVTLSAPDEATNGILTEEELAQLQASDNASIMFSHKKYDLGGKGHQEGYLTYTHAGYENNVHILESITITISTRAWVLNATDVLDEEEIKEAIAPMIPAAPTWKATAPTTDADKAKVQFTKVTITTADETNFPGMNGRYALIPGFRNDGFEYGTVVCSQADPAYEFPFIGSITSTMASGTIIKPGVAPTYVSQPNPEVTFTYEYLW